MNALKRPARLMSFLLAAAVTFAPTAMAADSALSAVNLPGIDVNEADAPLVVNQEITGQALGLGLVESEEVSVRLNPTEDSDVVLTVEPGQQVIVLSQEGDWYWINVGDYSGFVPGDELTVSEDGAAYLGHGLVRCSAANIRTDPDSESETVDCVGEQEAVTIVGITDGWYQVETRSGVTGYVRSDLVDPTAVVSAEKIYDYAVIEVAAANIRTAPDSSAEKSDVLYAGSLCTLVQEVGDWYEVRYGDTSGYVYAPLMNTTNNAADGSTQVETYNEAVARESAELAAAAQEAADRAAAAAAAASAQTPAVREPAYEEPSYEAPQEIEAPEYEEPQEEPAYEEPEYEEPEYEEPAYEESEYEEPEYEEYEYEEPEYEEYEYEEDEYEEPEYEEPAYDYSAGEQIIDVAYQYLGVPYVWGGTSPSGFDCSGFIQYVFSQCGYSVSRTADYQYYDGYAVSYDNLQAGDLVFFENTYATDGISHVGIYIGGGEFIHAANGGVKTSYLSDSYYSSRYYGACRIA